MFNEAALKEKLEAKYGKGNVRRSYLRQEQVIRNTKNQYEYNFDGNQSSVATERKLNQQDLFVAFAVGLFLLREDSTKIGSGVLRTNVDSTDFAAATGFTPAHLEIAYNGGLKAEVDNNTIFEALETSNFRKNPVQYMPQSGVVELEPALILNGTKKNKLTLSLPIFSGIQVESVLAGTDNKVVLVLFGFQIFNQARA